MDTPGMSVVGPLHGPKNRLTPSAAPCPLAAWALQGYSGSSQVVHPSLSDQMQLIYAYMGEGLSSLYLTATRCCVNCQSQSVELTFQWAVRHRSRQAVFHQGHSVIKIFCVWCETLRQSMQEVGLTRLAEWVRETARSGGLVSAPFCFGQQDAAARDWQSPAVEKRCGILAHAASLSRSIELGKASMTVQYEKTILYKLQPIRQTRPRSFEDTGPDVEMSNIIDG